MDIRKLLHGSGGFRTFAPIMTNYLNLKPSIYERKKTNTGVAEILFAGGQCANDVAQELHDHVL
jgi:hypothetical protein